MKISIKGFSKSFKKLIAEHGSRAELETLSENKESHVLYNKQRRPMIAESKKEGIEMHLL